MPATLLIIFRNLPMQWWLVAIGIYALRVGFSVNFGVAVVGLYVDSIGWQWLYWQDGLVALAMAILVFLGAPREPVNTRLLESADWGGMLLLGTGIAMVYSGHRSGQPAGLAQLRHRRRTAARRHGPAGRVLHQ